METEHRKELEKRHREFMKGKKLLIKVTNSTTAPNGIRAQVISKYESIEEAEHKVALDMMTNAYYGFEEPIEVKVKVKEKE